MSAISENILAAMFMGVLLGVLVVDLRNRRDQ